MKLTADSRFMIRGSFPGIGEGLFAVYPVQRGEFIVEYTGERIATGSSAESESRYLFMVNDEWTVDGPVPENTAAFINHACQPNTEAAIEDDRIMIYASRDVASGEELTIDYGPRYFERFIAPVGCKCAGCVSPSPRARN